MLPKLIDHPLVRISLGVLVGIPLSAVAMVATPHGLGLGYGGVIKGDPVLIFAGLMTVTGIVAIYGAWYRLLVPHVKMVAAQARRVRFCLYCGVISSLGLAGWAGYETEIALSFALALPAAIGVVLIKGTPIPDAL
ncbi:MAG: hypothetical protein HZA64_02665 [Rhodocyclales bacterium]|nr:hypothetical protein [Rhodocyclales bacterium]